MDYFEMLKALGMLFCCLGMVQPKDNDIFQDMKRNFNIAYFLMTIHQRALVIPMRNHYGTQALGLPCFLALILMLLWHMATHDDFILIWIGFWLLCLVKRRIQAVRLAKSGARIDSRYAGWPRDAIRFVRSEEIAKRYVEPLLIGILAGILFWFYGENGWRTTGLPTFFLSGVFSLHFVQRVNETVWTKRLQAMRDAQLENEMAARDYRDQYGD